MALPAETAEKVQSLHQDPENPVEGRCGEHSDHLNISWFVSCTADQRASQRVIRAAERCVGTDLPRLQDACTRRCCSRAIKTIKDASHSSNLLHGLLISGKQLCSRKTQAERLRRFYPHSIRLLNQDMPLTQLYLRTMDIWQITHTQWTILHGHNKEKCNLFPLRTLSLWPSCSA